MFLFGLEEQVTGADSVHGWLCVQFFLGEIAAAAKSKWGKAAMVVKARGQSVGGLSSSRVAVVSKRQI
jgi:hypothetical protein